MNGFFSSLIRQSHGKALDSLPKDAAVPTGTVSPRIPSLFEPAHMDEVMPPETFPHSDPGAWSQGSNKASEQHWTAVEKEPLLREVQPRAGFAEAQSGSRTGPGPEAVHGSEKVKTLLPPTDTRKTKSGASSILPGHSTGVEPFEHEMSTLAPDSGRRTTDRDNTQLQAGHDTAVGSEPSSKQGDSDPAAGLMARRLGRLLRDMETVPDQKQGGNVARPYVAVEDRPLMASGSRDAPGTAADTGPQTASSARLSAMQAASLASRQTGKARESSSESVQISIGRIEIKAGKPAMKAAEGPARTSVQPQLSLESYLEQRRNGLR